MRGGCEKNRKGSTLQIRRRIKGRKEGRRKAEEEEGKGGREVEEALDGE